MKNENNSMVQQLVDQAIAEVENVSQDDKPFMVRDLFLGYEWNRLSNYIRAQVGFGFFHQYADNESISQVEILKKTARNQQLYRKK
ncbi:MAG: single-stranded DNA-binding protein [Defluviitaleaceae bacterium]|nr:single-stranded DNA-binding protein [Defluviitaleaceae bacterium]